MPEQSMFPVPFVEAFVMAEDIRNEQNGQVSLVGVFSDCLFTKIWPIRFAKLCYMVRMRGLTRKCAHSLSVWALDATSALVNVDGTLDKLAENTEVAVFNYVFFGLAFEKPGRYVAKFSASDQGKTIISARYSFMLQVPNPDELYIECGNCHVKYGTGVVVKGSLDAEGCQSVCPQCKHSNPLDPRRTFRFSIST